MKKVISFVLTLAMMLGVLLIPSTAFAEPMPAILWIGGNTVTAGGTVTGKTGITGSVSYDATKCELTLNNASISLYTGDDALRYANSGTLTINLIGTNTIDSARYAIFAPDNLVITGSGILIATGGSNSVVIATHEKISIGGGAELYLCDAKVKSRAISSGAVEINNAEVSAVAHADTIYARNSLIITDGSIVKATTTDIDNEGYALYSGGEFKIYGSTVNAVSKCMAAMYSSVDIDVLENSNVTATAELYSVMANNNITVSGSGLESTAELGTAAACKTLKITNAKGNIMFSAAKNVFSVGAVELDEGYELQGDDTRLTLGKKIFDVLFNVDGTEYAKQSVKYGELATTTGITAPSKEGKSFVGWIKEGGSSIFNFDTAITESTTLNASWTDLSYTVNFDSKGGSSVASQTVKYNEKAIKPADPIKLDNTFGGWYRDLTYKNLFDFDTKITTNTDLYASWSAVEKPKEDPTPTNLDPTLNLDPTPTNLDPTPTNLDPTPTNLDPTPTDLEPKPTGFVPDGLGRRTEVTEAVVSTDAACRRDKSCPLTKYKDLDPLLWYHDGIHYCLEEKLMNGVGDGYFLPGDNITRAMTMTILARMAGIEVDGSGREWYKKGLDWAVLEGISDGTMPEGYITREQFATMLYRYAQKQGQGFKGSWMFLLKYTDRADVSSWANEAVHWCSMKGVLDGYEDGSLKPQGLLTRAEAAAMMQRLVVNGV